MPTQSKSYRWSQWNRSYTSDHIADADGEKSALRPSSVSALSTFREHYSSFVSLAAEIMDTEISHSSFDRNNFLRNMRDHDIGIWAYYTRPLGRGATFAVRRFVGDLESGSTDGQVAVKSVLSTYGDEREGTKRLASAMLELRVLSHPLVRRAENIMKLLSVGWECDPVERGRMWPALLVEYADQGTLTDFFGNQESVAARLKWHICLDVARALQVLHTLNVVHGDIKLLNVLVYTNTRAAEQPDRPVIAKIADVGGALLDMEARCSLPSGTFPWNAPETESGELMSRKELLQTDVYSFGLLIWRIWLDGKNPFRDASVGLFANPLTDGEIRHEKQKPEFKIRVQNSTFSSLDESERDYISHIRTIFDYSLTVDKSLRSLKNIISLLESNPCVASHLESDTISEKTQQTVPLQGDAPAAYSFKGMTFSQSMNDYIFDNWRASTKIDHASLRGEALEALAIGNLTGYDIRHTPNIDEGLSSMVQGAIDGNMELRSYIFRFHDTHGRMIPDQLRSHLVSWLADAVAHGSFIAREDLKALGEAEIVDDSVNRFYTRFCGIGEERFDEQNAFIFTASFADVSQLLITQNSSLNEWDDTILHAAVTTGRLEIVQFILKSFVDHDLQTMVNAVNKDQETPLLYAARCGHTEIVSLLLVYDADPSILSSRGESVLHYLTSFGDKDISNVAELLISKGAPLEAVARKGYFNDFIDHRTIYGTPLHFAVEQNLLQAVISLIENGADIHTNLPQVGITSPLALAASLHYHEVLEYMIRFLIEHSTNEEPEDFTIERATGISLLLYAIGGSDYGWSEFSKIARHGRLWKTRALATLNVLFAFGATKHFASLPGMPYCTAVFFAVRSDAHILEAILQTDDRSINVPARVQEDDEPRPPLFEAILYHRFEVFDVLVRYGVDLMARMNYEGDPITGLYYCAFARHERMEIADAILRAGVGVDEGPEGVETPFICAVRNRAFKIAKFFLEQNANPNAYFERGLFCLKFVPRTLLGVLLEETSPAMLSSFNFLLDNVSNLLFNTTEQSNWTILHCLATLDLWMTREKADPTLGEVLRRIKNYFKPTKDQLNEITTEEDNLFTALHLAADFGNFTVADWLVRNGADTSLLTRNGLTALDMAYVRTRVPGDEDIVDIPTPVSIQEAQAEAVRREVYEYLAIHTSSSVNNNALLQMLQKSVAAADQ